ncbi:MAG: BadF/BadG/BcrA/BcrD ATPase family protein [Myxococcota bacterium]
MAATDSGLVKIGRRSIPKAKKSEHPPMPDAPCKRFEGTAEYPQGLMIGLDVGSTTVKAVVINPLDDAILWKDYRRHETKQPEKVVEFLKDIEDAFPKVPKNAFRLFATGSGASAQTPYIGGKFAQEVNAVGLAVEKLYPDVRSVVELGGQDAKIIVFKEDPKTGTKKKIPSMNDKCAGGTGAVIEKIAAKLKIPSKDLCNMGYNGLRLHPVAGKCGVFAETDVNGLQKQGVPPDELMASLFESIVQQNLSVLTRGHTLRPTVLLLGGPNCYIKGMRDAWKHNIPLMWKERGVTIPDPAKEPADYIVTPDDAQYFAALGAVLFGKLEVQDNADTGLYQSWERLQWYVEHGRLLQKLQEGGSALSKNDAELAAFKQRYRPTPWEPTRFEQGQVVEGFIGLDGGSTSTKCVLLSKDKTVLAKAYQLSKGNPIQDSIDVLTQLREQVTSQGATLRILGVSTTGYAKDVLKDVLSADCALVETVAHTQSGLHYFPNANCVVDVGGQDIKLIVLQAGKVKDFKLNTQCSAGNGYFLQSTAGGFGYDVREYADLAFSAKAMPKFGYGCAVFMQTDIVDFQRQGWQASEIMAGLADVLPKNIWLYVAQIANLAQIGTHFVLQGGTQYNLAAVKSQVDFIEGRFHGTGATPQVVVHPHCGEAGAIGCAIEAHRLWERGLKSAFIGLDKLGSITYRTTRNEATRCYFCKNNCLRTFIDYKTGDPANKEKAAVPAKTKVPLAADEQRLIISTCEKGTVEDVDAMRLIKQDMDNKKKAIPNLMEGASRSVFRNLGAPNVADAQPRVTLMNFFNKAEIDKRRAAMQTRAKVRIGLPRVLNMYSQAPFFTGFFTALGIPFNNLIWSDYTTQEMYKAGAKRGSIDPCYPSKLGIPHVHDLLVKHKKRKLTHIFFPQVDSFPTFLRGVQASRACPTVVSTAEASHAAFTKETDLFKEQNIVFKKTFLNLDNPGLAARQMLEDWGTDLGLSHHEAERAVHAGLACQTKWAADLRKQGRELLETLEREDRIGVVCLARPYHNDPGVSHGILEELQKRGYPVFYQDSLPLDADILERLFGDEVRTGDIPSPLSVEDVWKNSYSENTSRKVWAAKYTARHPNLVALELSSFKCGHDAPIYSVVEEIIERSGTPYFCFKDIDENKPAGSIKIRIETIDYFLRRYREDLIDHKRKRAQVEAELKTYEEQLRQAQAQQVEA